MNFNKVILGGRLLRDPEIKYTPKGQAIARLGIATSRKFKSGDGEEKEETAFVDVEAWGKQAEVISQYLKKGNPLFIEGRLKLDTWDDKESGKKLSKLKVVLESFQFVGGKSEKSDSPAPQGQTKSQAADDSEPPF